MPQRSTSFESLKIAYPDEIKKITARYIIYKDGTRIPIQHSFFLVNWLSTFFNHLDHSYGSISNKDILHEQYEPLFRKMYGNSAKEVEKKLVKIYWMPHVFGKQYPLRVTTINDVDKKLMQVSSELEKLPVQYYKYLEQPASSYYWRNVAGESHLSFHSFGVAIDINLKYSNYWLWDFLKLKKPISDLRYHKIVYQNKIPLEIVQIFQKYGFFWGGNWYFYDTMHFEYRPDLLASSA